MSLIARLKKLCVYFFSGLIVLLFILWGASFIVLPWQVNKQLEPLELSLSDDASLSFNPFRLHVQIDDLAIVDKALVTQLSLKHAHLNLSWTDVLFKQVVLEKAMIESLHVNITRNNEQLVIAGFDLSADKSQSAVEEPAVVNNEPVNKQVTSDDPLAALKGWRFLIPNFALTDIALNINDQGQSQKVALNALTVNKLVASLDEVSVNVALDAAINASSLNVTSDINATLVANQLATATINNQLDIVNFSLQDWQYLLPLEDNQISHLAGLISLNISQNITLNKNKWQVIQPKLRLAINDINVIKPELELLNKSIAFELNELTVNGQDSSLVEVTGQSNLMIEGVNVNANGDKLASLASLSLPMVEFAVDDKFAAIANIPSVLFKDIVFSKLKDSEQALYENEEFSINDISWQENHLAIDTINLGKFNTEVILSAEKQLKNLVAIEPSETADAQTASTDVAGNAETAEEEKNNTDKEEAETAQAVTISLNKFELTSPSDITFIDESVTPIFKQVITMKKITANDINSRDTSYMSPFDVEMSLGEHATNTISGTIAPFGKAMNMTLDVALSELSMPPLSSYLRTVLGFDFLSGQLDNKINLVIKDDEMNGETVIGLRGFELASGDDTTDVSASTGGAMGLNSALNMLKDSQGNVSLSVPLSGNINDPSFGISNVLTLVAKKAIMSQAKSYLINTFVPYANVITVASIAGEYLLRVEMNDLVYNAGQVELSEEQQPFLNELAALLKDKPEQQVKMCAIASIDELSVVAATNVKGESITILKELSKKRGDNLKNILIKTHEINSSRLLLCAPRVEDNEGAIPRIEFSF